MFERPSIFYNRAKNIAQNNRRYLPTVALFAGFVWDTITLGRPDQLFDNLVILFYLVLAGVMIVLLNRQDERGKESSLTQFIIVQFSFGNLASALFVIFGKSGTLVGSWPFLLVFVALLIGNEFMRGKQNQLRIHVAIYYLFLLSYSVLIVPVLARAIGPEIFFVSGVLSIVLIVFFLSIVYKAAPKQTAEHKQHLLGIVTAVFIGFNVFYIANLIPPVPLSLRDIGIYHNVTRSAENFYVVIFEKGKWYEPWKRSDETVHYSEGDEVFCFSSVFAPARISTPIFHRWEYYDETIKEWETSTRISFPISGGRDEGFRGYSVKDSLFFGKWRCSVETGRGELIGRRTFKIVESFDPPALETGIR